MDVLTIILACSVYPDDHLVRAMVELASQNNQHFVGDLATLLAFDQAKDKAAAERVVTEVARQGGRPAIGLMGVPIAWAGRHGKTTPALLDACTNVWVGTTVLAAHEQACVRALTTTANPSGGQRHQRSAPPEAVRLCALRRYGADLGIEGYADAVFRYLSKQRVLIAWSGSAGGGPPSGADPAMCRCDEPRPPRPVVRRKPPATPAVPARPPMDLDDDLPPSPALSGRTGSAAGSLNPGLAPILD
jgi:hypothetical protein